MVLFLYIVGSDVSQVHVGDEVVGEELFYIFDALLIGFRLNMNEFCWL